MNRKSLIILLSSVAIISVSTIVSSVRYSALLHSASIKSFDSGVYGGSTVITGSIVITIQPAPGEYADVDCGHARATASRLSASVIRVRCATLTATPRATATATASARPTPFTATDTPTPTATAVANALDPVAPEILGTCSAAIHDRYTVTGPDGRLYRTWHPQRDPSGCVFAHEHGDDPRTSLANPSLPPFGYVGFIAGDNEPHEGFKVFVANAGTLNDEGNRANHSTRVVAHMGTGGPKRFGTRFHSFIFDMVAADGSRRYVHVQGMADTGGVGSICSTPRQGKTVVIVRGQGCDLDSLYEIWQFDFTVRDSNGNVRVEAIASPSLFDPITAMNTLDPTALVLTRSQYPQFGDNHGCERETYHGPIFWYNKGGSVLYFTDAFGNPGGALRQEVSAHSTDFSKIPAFDAESSGRFTQFKLRSFVCAPGLGVKN